MPTILALDQGTTSSRAILFDEQGRIVSSAQREFTQHFPAPGRVEHDPLEIWDSQLAVARKALAESGGALSEVSGIGITNQRETVLVWERATGTPLGPAIVWQDRRTAERCAELERDGHAESIQQKTGLIIDAYFSASKLGWILERVPGARARAERGELAFGTVDSWLIWNLTAGRVHVTDVSNASRTMLFDIHRLDWDDELLALFDVPRSMMPHVVPSSGVIAESDADLLGISLPIAGIAGDQQSALFGQACFEPGLAKCTYGTGCFLLAQTGSQPVRSTNRLLSSVGWQIGDEVTYALEGSVFVGGAVVQWLRDGLGIIGSSSEVEALAASVEDNAGVHLVPAFAGLGAPHWDAFARGAIVGLTRGSSAAHLARAALESIAFQVSDILGAVRQDAATPLRSMRVDGGAAANDLLMQFQADLLGTPIERPSCLESTALGAAYLAGLGTGVWSKQKDIAAIHEVERVFEPAMAREEAARRLARWNDALERARGWEDPAS